MAFRGSNKRVPAYKSGLSPRLNSPATIRERICIGLSLNAVSMSIHFVSIGNDVVLCHSCVLIDLCTHAKFTKICHILSACLLHSRRKQILSNDVVNALDEFILFTSSCQHRILLRFRVLLLTILWGDSSQLSCHPSRPSPMFQLWISNLDLPHQFSNFPNLVDLQLICRPFTAGELSQRCPRNVDFFMFPFCFARFKLRSFHSLDLLSFVTSMSPSFAI